MRRILPVILTILVTVAATCIAQEKCYVFFPTTVRSQVVQEKLQGSLDGVTVLVFARLNDFSLKLQTDPPDAIITKPSLISQFADYDVTLNGVRKGKIEETYVILSIENPVDVKTIKAQTTIGIVDVLGRTEMKSFVSQFFPVEPKLKRVTKIEDLLPLLSFNMAEGVLIEDVFVNYFESMSQLNFKITSLPLGRNGIIALGVKKNSKADKTTSVLKRADKVLCSIFEVESWK